MKSDLTLDRIPVGEAVTVAYLGESGIRDKYNCMVVGLEEGKENLSPIEPSRPFAKGDIIWIVGEEEALQELLSV